MQLPVEHRPDPLADLGPDGGPAGDPRPAGGGGRIVDRLRAPVCRLRGEHYDQNRQSRHHQALEDAPADAGQGAEGVRPDPASHARHFNAARDACEWLDFERDIETLAGDYLTQDLGALGPTPVTAA